MDKQLTPFHDEDGNLKFSYQPLRDLVFVFPTPPPEKVGDERVLHIPEQFRKQHQDSTGVVLAIGPGYQNNKGEWFRPSPELQSGVKVYFDNTVPWGQRFFGLDGKEYYIFLCGISDVWCVAED